MVNRGQQVGSYGDGGRGAMRRRGMKGRRKRRSDLWLELQKQRQYERLACVGDRCKSRAKARASRRVASRRTATADEGPGGGEG